jgi:hypothetical protein
MKPTIIQNKKGKEGSEDTTVCVRSWKARLDFINIKHSPINFNKRPKINFLHSS